MFQNYSMSQAERVPIVKKLAGRQGLQLLETICQAEQEACNAEEGLFKTNSNRFIPQYNDTIKSIKFQKTVRQHNKNAQHWMGRLRIAAIECNYKEIDRQWKEQYIHGLNDNDMMVEIIKKLTKSEENKDVTSNQAPQWARQVEAQITHTAVLNNLKINQEFDAIQLEKQKKYKHKPQQSQTSMCKYCVSNHLPQRCPAYGKRCGKCGKMNHSTAVCRSDRHKAVHKVE